MSDWLWFFYLKLGIFCALKIDETEVCIEIQKKMNFFIHYFDI